MQERRRRLHNDPPCLILGEQLGRRFAAPVSSSDIDAAFVVKDGGGQKVAYVHYAWKTPRRYLSVSSSLSSSLLSGRGVPMPLSVSLAKPPA